MKNLNKKNPLLWLILFMAIALISYLLFNAGLKKYMKSRDESSIKGYRKEKGSSKLYDLVLLSWEDSAEEHYSPAVNFTGIRCGDKDDDNMTLLKSFRAQDDGINSLLFHRGNIRSWSDFIKSLQNPETKDKKRIFQLLDNDSKNIISAWEPGKELTYDEKYLLIEGLNKILKRRDFFNNKAFDGNMLCDKGQVLLKKGLKNLSEEDIIKFNRLLFEAICPQIKESYDAFFKFIIKYNWEHSHYKSIIHDLKKDCYFIVLYKFKELNSCFLIDYDYNNDNVLLEEIGKYDYFWPNSTPSDFDSVNNRVFDNYGNVYRNVLDLGDEEVEHLYMPILKRNDKIYDIPIDDIVSFFGGGRYAGNDTYIYTMPYYSPNIRTREPLINIVIYVYQQLFYHQQAEPTKGDPSKNIIYVYQQDLDQSKFLEWGYFPLNPEYKVDEFFLPLDISNNNQVAFISCFSDKEKKEYELWLSIWNYIDNKAEKVAFLDNFKPRWSFDTNPIITWNNNDNYENLLAHNIRENLSIIDTQKKEIIKTLDSIPSNSVLVMRWSNNGEKLGILYYTDYRVKDRKLFIYDLVKDSETLIENVPADSFDFFWVD